MKRGGLNVYVNERKKKAFFVDGMTDHFDNFIKRMEKEGKEIIIPGKRTIASTCSYASFSAIIVSHDTESKKLST